MRRELSDYLSGSGAVAKGDLVVAAVAVISGLWPSLNE